MSSTPSEAYTDVVELCAMLQCLGFSVKSVETSESNISQDGATRTIIINCQSSGLHVVLESEDLSCSCPSNTNQQNSGFWQVSGVTGGKQLNKEYGSALLGSLPKAHRERLTKQLQEMVRCIKENNESDIEKYKERDSISNKSASLVDLETPDKKHLKIKSATPTRYRSLDTLTAGKEASFPAPGLQKQNTTDVPDAASDAGNKNGLPAMCQRQSTYTLSSTSGVFGKSNKTSSPIQRTTQNSGILENLIAAEKTAEDLKNIISSLIRDFTEESKNDSSMSSLVLDVSKISVLKGPENSKLLFSSSPNLAGLVTPQDDLSSRLKRVDSASTSNLVTGKLSLDGKTSRLRRLSPNIFKCKKDNPSLNKLQKLKNDDKNSKLTNLFKPKALTTAQASKAVPQVSPNLSATKKKFSHVKSTIPRPASKKE